MAEQSKCPVCSEKATLAAPYQGGSSKLNCVRCGSFEIGIIAANEISAWKQQQRTNLSGWICEHQDCKILSPDLNILASLRTPTVGEKAEKLLTFLANEFPKPGEKIASDVIFSIEGLDVSSVDQPKVFVESQKLVSVSWSLDLHELGFLIYEYLVAEKNFLSQIEGSNLKITPKGWSQIDSLRQGNPQSKTGFIAMWFDKSVDQAHLAIETGIRNAGYKPFRVDQKEHNNDITDEIIAGIRGSKFLVADLTNHRNGVYYEAGFAKGLGLEVVWLCRKSDEKDRHFDIRQLSTIFWEEDKLPELSKALENRIVATIGRGPLTGNALS
jgi:Zn ribbon nucleic-acid-binding protein